MQLALWLGLRAGLPDLFDDVERLIRARLLPSQIMDEKNPRSDGAWGVYSHPFGCGGRSRMKVIYKQVSVLDDKTTEICRKYDGKTWDENLQPIGHKLPYDGGTPRHFNCRSQIVVLPAEEK